MKTAIQKHKRHSQIAYSPALVIAANDAVHQVCPLDGTAKVTNKDVLIICWDDSNIGRIATLFEGRGYLVSVRDGNQPLDHSRYGAVIHTARTSQALPNYANTTQYQCVDEWALIARDELDDIHCAVQLTVKAHPDLQAYVRYLWALCNLT